MRMSSPIPDERQNYAAETHGVTSCPSNHLVSVMQPRSIVRSTFCGEAEMMPVASPASRDARCRVKRMTSHLLNCSPVEREDVCSYRKSRGHESALRGSLFGSPMKAATGSFTRSIKMCCSIS